MIIVVGAGVAGLTAVNQLVARGTEVMLVTAGRFGGDSTSAGNTALAQGGIAAALGPDDQPKLHTRDTVKAGAGLVVPEIAHIVAVEGAQRVWELIATGFPADRTAAGDLVFGLEAAHCRPRIVHAGEDSTGAALSTFLTEQVRRHIDTGAVRLVDQVSLQHIHTVAGRIAGITVDGVDGSRYLTAESVILATGGYAGLYANTSSSAASTGLGLLAATRAGAVVSDMEFVQFHPTVVVGTRQLISEAVRGAGAVLRDPAGKRFMTEAHPDAELAPRDVVSRASAHIMREFGTSLVWLDATVIEQHHGPGTLATRFPVLTAALAGLGIDWRYEYVPVAPAAHYCMGGVATDAMGRTSIPGLYAAGEVASTGLHGANRLASNSLLEGLVFGTRAAQAIQHDRAHGRWEVTADFEELISEATALPATSTRAAKSPHNDSRLSRLVDAHLGITRNHHDVMFLCNQLDHIDDPMVDLVQVMATAALHRTESRGGHWRADYPTTDPTQATRTAWRLQPAPGSRRDQLLHQTLQESLDHVDA